MRYKIAEADAMELIQYTYEKNTQAFREAAEKNIIDASSKSIFPDKVSFEYNFAEEGIWEKVISSVTMHNDNALFYQLRECLEIGHGSFRTNPESILQSIIYVDFSKIYPKKKDSKYALDAYDDNGRCAILENFFQKGFTFIYEDGTKKKYVPFDKSGNMSRNSRMTFVDRKLVTCKDKNHNLDSRLRLDIDFSLFKINLSKYYAYRGLYLSDAARIEFDSFCPLNEETVIVLPDTVYMSGNRKTTTKPETEDTKTSIYTSVNHSLKPQDVITVDKDRFSKKITDEEGKKHIGTVEMKVMGKGDKKNEIRVTAFDGEGIISPEYAAHINEMLGGRKKAASFQIRMPFIKGVLHEVDFHKFIDEYVLSNAGETDENGYGKKICILDAYGIRRDLSKAQIVLTESMFKAKKWLGAYIKALGENMPSSDPMAYYFEKFSLYDHGFYLRATDLSIMKDTTRLNYQYINPLAMTPDEFGSLVKKHVEAADDIAREHCRRLQLKYERGRKPEAWEYALMVNPDFAEDDYIAGKLKDEKDAFLKDLGLGHIKTDGCQRILSDDLLSFMKHMVKCLNVRKGAINTAVKKIEKDFLHADRFYLPQAPEAGLGEDKWYAIFRSPHLSRNEECVLRPYIPGDDNVYSRYFSGLKGVVMLSYNSEAALVLGGADFDGDFVQIYFDDIISKAVLRGAYKNSIIENEKKAENTSSRSDFSTSFNSNTDMLPFYYDCARGKREITEVRKERALPLALINAPKAREETISPKMGSVYYKNMFRTIHNTFSNNVGKISNLAFALGRKAYFGPVQEREKYEQLCAMCTIVTGLDIDAAKNGIHPDIEKWLRDNGINYGQDYYIREKERIEKEKTGSVNKSTRYDELCKKLFKPEVTSSNTADAENETETSEGETKVTSSGAEGKSKEENVEKSLAKIIFTYGKYKKYKAAASKKRAAAVDYSGNIYMGYLHKILHQEYNYDYDCIPGSSLKPQSAAEKAFREMSFCFKSAEDINAALDELKECRWEFALEEEREELLLKILNKKAADRDGNLNEERQEGSEAADGFSESANLSADTKALLLDPGVEGYKVLFYMLKALYENMKPSATKESAGEFAQTQSRALPENAQEAGEDTKEDGEDIKEVEEVLNEAEAERAQEEYIDRNDLKKVRDGNVDRDDPEAVRDEYVGENDPQEDQEEYIDENDTHEGQDEYDNDLYAEIKRICKEARENKESDDITGEQVREICLDRVKELFVTRSEGGEKSYNMKEALECTLSLRKRGIADKNGSFFWEIFTLEDISAVVIHDDERE